MRSLSIQEQKQIVGGDYYFKVFKTNGQYVSGTKTEGFDDLFDCADACKQYMKDNNYGAGYCGRVYDADTGKMWRL